MKRALVTGFVAVLFIVYSWQQRHQTTAVIVKAPTPATIQTKPATPQSTTTSQSPSTSNTSDVAPTTGTYKDGSYPGTVADAFYGNLQVLAVISNGQLSDVRFLQYPNDSPNSIAINAQAMPMLRQEAIKAQSAKVDVVSGATNTSQAFTQSLTAALKSAHS